MLAQGAGFTPFNPPKPKPQPSYGYSAMAPSGPYASPRPQASYGFDPLSQSGQSLQAPSAAPFMPTKFGIIRRQPGAQPIDEWYAAQGNLIRGGRPADPTTMGHLDSAAYAANLIATLAPVGALSGAMKAPALARGAMEAPSAVERIIGGSSAPVRNPGLLGRLGEHADNAERVLAFKSFDAEMQKAQREAMLKQYSLSALLRGEQPPALGLQYGFERRKFPR